MKRYLLDLSKLFKDHRRKAYIGYRPTWTTVASVIGTIRSTFNIQSDLYICSEEGIFYPEGEQAELICDEKVIKVLPKGSVVTEKILSDDEPRQRRVSNAQQESSTYEDIEATLLNLPKPKRHRVRKRKIKQNTTEAPAPSHSGQSLEKVQKAVSDSQRNGHIQSFNEEAQSSESSKSSDELELPYRNLNRNMKARVVRAVSPSELIDRSVRNGSEPSTETSSTATANEVPSNSEQTQSKITNTLNIKARIVRATNVTVELKQEQLNEAASGAMEQSYQPQTTVEDTEVIEVDAPTHVDGEEDTHCKTSAV
ncbi:uncharacterized protein LOC126560503 [Anopheles maculipalpis]|uniref:uncharacterized protein LOC126560503 n=1 Tax=Anopheles maculipalpis TaxID=1496333 RepID=UPI002158DDE1|nr:uncharacterized protein LOC126560503 [Anopheles maculipalpis]